MSVNNTNNNFKVSTVGKSTPQDEWATQTTDPKAEGIDDLFDMGPEGSSGSTQNSNPIDDYTLGEIQNGTYTTGADADGAMWLESFPPTLEEVMAGNENAVNYLDLVNQRYEKAKEDLHALKISYEQAIASGTLIADEIKVINERFPLVDQALARCGAQMDKITELSGEREKIFIQEQRSMKDLNNDNWIGRPRAEGSYYLNYNDDGTITFVNSEGVPVAAPLMDPEYKAKLLDNDSLSVIAADQSITSGNEDLATTDVFLKLSESSLNNSNTFGAPIDIGIPEYFWVERADGDDVVDSVHKMEFDENQTEWKMALYNEWDSAGGLTQKVPDDLSKYAQVKVTGVNVYSELIEEKTADGDPLYRHVVEFKNGEDLITRISIEGFETSKDLPVATDMDGGGKYVAASSVGIAFHGADSASPKEFDASGLISTGRHIVPSLAADLGISSPGDGGQGDTSFGDNIGAFSERDFLTTEWIGLEWKETSHDLDNYDGSNDRYLSPSDDSNGEGPYATFKTGVFITGIRGDIKGSSFNDVIVTLGVNEYSDYANEHLPDDAKQIAKGDASYSNFVNANGGNDIVKAGRGDNYISEATFVWINDCKSQDENFIALPDMPVPTALKDNVKTAPNQRTFVHVNGGHSQIYNPVEYNIKNDANANDEDQVEANDGSYKDDWYEITGGGSAEFGNINDGDLDYCQEQGAIAPASGNGFDKTFFENAKSDPNAAWYDELTSVPDPDEMDLDIDWDEVMGAKTDLDAEMNSFFDQMFGDLNSFIGEYQEEQQTGI
ncbi:MAG: hypothetical protein ABH871_09330 [Pseudomonadota bacterium]